MVDLQLAPGHGTGGHVHYKGSFLICRHGQGDRVGAIDGIAAEGGHHQYGGVGRRNADHALFQGHHGIVAGNAIVVAVPYGSKPAAIGLGLLYGLLHGPVADRLAQSCSTVDGDRCGRFVDGLNLGLGNHHAVAQTVDVARQAGHAVRIDPAQVGLDQHVGRDLGVLGRDAHLLKGSHAKIEQFLVAYHTRCFSHLFLLV